MCALAGSVIALVSAGAVLAHEGATGVVKQRMEMMKAMAAQMKALKSMVDGQTAYDPDVIAAVAEKISTHAASIAPSFPSGANQHPSEARPEIWTDWDSFKTSAEKLRAGAAALREIAANGAGPAKPSFVEMAKTCRDCHESYRVKKQ